MFTDITPMFSFERLRWFETPAFNMALLAVCAVMLLSVLVAAVVRTVRWRRPDTRAAQAKETAVTSPPGDDATRRERIIDIIQLALAAGALLFVAGAMVWGNPTPFFGVSLGFNVVLGLGVLVAVLTAGAVVGVVLAWKEGYWRLSRRIHYSIGTLAAVGFVWFLDTWNLLGWRY